MLATLRRLWAHLAWADETLLAALETGTPSPEIVREYAHILGADEIWLARLEQRAPRTPVWPSATLEELRAMAATVHEGYRTYFDTLNEETSRIPIPPATRSRIRSAISSSMLPFTRNTTAGRSICSSGRRGWCLCRPTTSSSYDRLLLAIERMMRFIKLEPAP